MSFKWNAAVFRKMAKKVGEENFAPGVKESVKKFILENHKIVMGRAKRGLYAGRHIQYGNQISEDGGNKSRRTWKPNIQDKRLFSYILDRHIQVKVSTHALKCIDKAGGIDEYLLKTPYHKMDTEMGFFWKAKIEKMYKEQELGQMDVEDEAKFEHGFKDLKLAERAAQKEARRKNFTISRKQKLIKEGKADSSEAEADSENEAEAVAI